MTRIDNSISIIMVFVTAIGFSRALSVNVGFAALIVIGAFVLYELIQNAANSNPSIRTVLYVTMGFIFGLSLAVIIDFEKGWLSAVICLLCMGYKYMIAEATVSKRSRSRNIFVIVVNAFFYASMFTVIEWMAFAEWSVLYVMIYVVSFAFFMCSYIAYKSMAPARSGYTASGVREPHDVGNEWQHIVKRTINYGRQLRDQFEDALDNSGDTFSGLFDELRKRIIPDYTDVTDINEEIGAELDEYRKIINEIANREELDDNELEILDRINSKFDTVYYDFYKEGNRPILEYETEISELKNDIEMLRNTINIRKQREAEDREREEKQNRRSQAQQARRKREREERERREREEREAAGNRARNEQESEDEEEAARSAEEEKKRREDERKRQEKRRRERNKRTTDSSSGSGASGGRTSGSRTSSGSSSDKSKDKDKVAGMETKYFKGCVTLDDLSLRYKKLCLIYHPDSGSGDVDTYIELKDEYELLKKRLS
ncbi:MAG: J domain-containing protein [Lachnospiraceae bacterium]|nr:J domain-containing protein [Lachnospiraceae bacterium]